MSAVSQLNAALTGRYVVDREIGAGGMATVYLARDIKHDRNVALKVLLPELGAILGAERFQSEIKVTANLQHPNLLPLFDSGEANGLLFYVMPYVEGESLRARLDREKQLPINEAIRIASAVASALDYAHRHNVIHRDLKPENILLHDGQPLVADFGIALAVSKAGGQRVTQTGLSLGTPQYMSPEQATGDRAIDGRTDIYSLGAVTYEMLAGEPPHLGTTAQAIIAKVLTEAPRSVRLARPSVPEHVEAAVEKALEKLAADRWATAKEFGDALVNEHGTHATSASGTRARAKASKPGLSARAQIAIAIGAAIVGVIATKAAERWLDDTPDARALRFVLALPDSQGIWPMSNTYGRLALSRDGAQLAYVGLAARGTGLYLRSLADPTPRLLAGTEGASSPSFAPNGESIAFIADSRLKKLVLTGGSPVTVSDSATTVEWSADNEFLFGWNLRVYTVSASGGPPRLIAAPDTAAGVTGFFMPSMLPGGTHALVSVIKRTAASAIGVMEIANGKLTELGVDGGTPRYDGKGHLLFGRLDGTLYAVPFSERRHAVTGPELPVARGVMAAGQAQRTDYALAHDGTLAFVGRDDRPRHLLAVDRQGRSRPLGSDERLFGWPSLSPDGKRVAIEVEDPTRGRWDVWIYDFATRTLSRLSTGYSGVRPGGWSDDSRRVLFIAAPVSNNAGRRILSQPWDGGEAASTFLEQDRIQSFSVGPAHTYLAFAILPASRRDIWIAPLDSLDKAVPFAATDANETWPRVSRDGRYLAYVSNESGANEVYVRPLPGPGARVQVSAGGGVDPEWAPNGREIFYRTPAHLVSATLTAGNEMSVARRDTLFDDTRMRGPNGFSVFPNGNEFLMVSSEQGASSTATVIINWQALLKKQ